MSSSSSSPQWKYDVFVSFRGKDVRRTFLAYLNLRLNLEGFRYFCDEDREHIGNKIEDIIFPSIPLTRVALIVLSENYADSRWCLKELVEILRCNKNHKNPEVIPVFYGVGPADVKNLTSRSKIGQAFERLLQRAVSDQQRKEWTEALQGVAEISGLEKEKFGKEPDLLNEIVRTLRGKIGPRSLCYAEKVIGADRLRDDVTPLLKIGQEDVSMRVIGISGPEGIGKTMVARAACEGTLGEPHRLIFLNNVGKYNDDDFVKLQKKLLRNLNIQYDDNSHDYIEMIKFYPNREKILLVLDDLTKEEQRKKLGVENGNSFCQGSRVLITTRDRKLLKDLEVDDEYIVEGLNRDEAFRLFCRHAFEGEEPKEGYEELSRYLAHYAGGHPLALRKWGSYLKKLRKDDWQKLSDELVKNPESNSFLRRLDQTFLKYPCRVVGTRGGDRKTKSWEDGEHKGVKCIEGGVDPEGIKFITVQYDNGFFPRTVTRGTKGDKTHTIKLDYPGEYLIYMSGHTKEDSGRTILQSLTFHTNTGKRESIGRDEEGRKFSFPYTGHKIVGFRGSCYGSHLESIEAIYKRTAHTPIGYSGEVFGPFGGAGEKLWHSDDINGISVRYADFISEITFKVSKISSSKPLTTYGGNGGVNTFEVRLENSYECITSFSGYFENARDGRILIKSLTFRTNKRILGPIGREEGKHFSSPSPSKAVKVTRFFGRTVDYYLESIGAQVETYYPFKSVGLFGCSNASNWDDRDDDYTNVKDDYTNVKEITVEFALDDGKSVGSVQKTIEKTFIQSITFCYGVNNDREQTKGHPGTSAKGFEHFRIKIHYPNEYLTSMSGYYLDDGITSLTFGTNKRMLEPIGREEGIHFSSPVTGGKIVRFYGRSDENLKAIGAYFKPVSDFYPINSIGPFRGSSGENRDGSSGETWGPRKFKDVRKIKVTHDINIHCIDFEYDNRGDQSYPVTYKGCAEGDYPKDLTITLNYPREYLTMISGYAHNGVIQSLTFYSNKGIYGPCGEEMGKYFWYPSNGSRIIGFYGTMDPNEKTLKSIGVYVEPIPRMYPFKTVGPFGGFVGTEWDDGVHTDVRGFRISFGKAIKAIGIAYDNNGSFVSGSEHGSGYNRNGSFMLGLEPGKKCKTDTYIRYKEVILDYPKERLLSISVWVEEDAKTGHRIHDLRIFTTKDDYGPFILDPWQKQDKLTEFHIPSQHNDGRIVGFFGRVERYLLSIGARLEP